MSRLMSLGTKVTMLLVEFMSELSDEDLAVLRTMGRSPSSGESPETPSAAAPAKSPRYRSRGEITLIARKVLEFLRDKPHGASNFEVWMALGGKGAMSRDKMRTIIDKLRDEGMVELRGTTKVSSVYMLTEKGHTTEAFELPQRLPTTISPITEEIIGKVLVFLANCPEPVRHGVIRAGISRVDGDGLRNAMYVMRSRKLIVRQGKTWGVYTLSDLGRKLLPTVKPPAGADPLAATGQVPPVDAATPAPMPEEPAPAPPPAPVESPAPERVPEAAPPARPTPARPQDAPPPPPSTPTQWERGEGTMTALELVTASGLKVDEVRRISVAARRAQDLAVEIIDGIAHISVSDFKAAMEKYGATPAGRAKE